MARNKDFNETEVLDKALSVFWQKGYNGTSMQDLVDGLGISRSSLYDTYTDKYNLFIKALEKYREEASGNLMAMVGEGPSAKTSIKKILQALVKESVKDEQQRGCFMVNAAVETAPHDKTVAKIVQDNMQDVENAFYSAIKKGQENGEISKQHQPRALARFIFNNIQGIRVAVKSGADKKVFDDIIKIALSVFE